MEHQRILNLLNDANDSKFLTRKWNIVNDTSKLNYDADVLKSNFCDYNDYQILVRGDITVAAADATQVAYKNCLRFTKCIKKIDGTTMDGGKDLDLVIPVYNFI